MKEGAISNLVSLITLILLISLAIIFHKKIKNLFEDDKGAIKKMENYIDLKNIELDSLKQSLQVASDSISIWKVRNESFIQSLETSKVLYGKSHLETKNNIDKLYNEYLKLVEYTKKLEDYINTDYEN